MQVTNAMVAAALRAAPKFWRDYSSAERHMRAALEAALAEMWRPVSEAKTNQHMLVFCPDAADHTKIMICARLEFDGDPDEPAWFELNCEDRPCPIDVEPTHFMHLPPPPRGK